MEWYEALVAAFILTITAYTLGDIQRRVKTIQIIQARRSITYLKILNELNTVNRLILLAGEKNSSTRQAQVRTYHRRNSFLAHAIDSGPEIHNILAGIEFPSFEDDKSFWNNDKPLTEILGLIEPDIDEKSEEN